MRVLSPGLLPPRPPTDWLLSTYVLPYSAPCGCTNRNLAYLSLSFVQSGFLASMYVHYYVFCDVTPLTTSTLVINKLTKEVTLKSVTLFLLQSRLSSLTSVRRKYLKINKRRRRLRYQSYETSCNLFSFFSLSDALKIRAVAQRYLYFSVIVRRISSADFKMANNRFINLRFSLMPFNQYLLEQASTRYDLRY